MTLTRQTRGYRRWVRLFALEVLVCPGESAFVLGDVAVGARDLLVVHSGERDDQELAGDVEVPGGVGELLEVAGVGGIKTVAAERP